MNLRGFLPKFAVWIISIKKDENKVGFAISFIENAEIRYGWGSNLLKRTKSKFWGIYFMKKAQKSTAEDLHQTNS